MEPNAERNELRGIRRTGVMAFVDVHLAVKHDEENPEYGNEELVSFLAQVLGIDKEKVSILKGKNTRIKVIGIDGLDTEQAMEKLKAQTKG